MASLMLWRLLGDADFSQYADDIIQDLAVRIRNHAAIRKILAYLDEDEGDSLVQSLTITAMDEAIGEY